MIQTTVPRELAKAPANGRRLMPLRRANTDPLDAASRIANVLAQAPVDAAKVGPSASVICLELALPGFGLVCIAVWLLCSRSSVGQMLMPCVH